MTIVTLITTLFNQLYDGISSSVGNFLVEKSEDEQYELFKKIEFINSFLCIFCTVCLATLITPFVSLWLGEDSTLQQKTVLLIATSTFLGFTRKPIGTIKSAAGLFEQDKFAPLIESFINLVSSCIFAKFFGLSGIVMGTILSSIAVPLWLQPKIVFKNIFHRSMLTYFLVILKNMIFSSILIFLFIKLFPYIFVVNQFLTLIIYFLITIIVTLSIELLFFCKNKYFVFLKQTILKK